MEEEKMITIRVRKAIEAGPKYKRAARAMKYIRDYLKKHFHTEKVKIDKSINEKVWENGAKNPPIKIRILVHKKDDLIEAKLL